MRTPGGSDSVRSVGKAGLPWEIYHAATDPPRPRITAPAPASQSMLRVLPILILASAASARPDAAYTFTLDPSSPAVRVALSTRGAHEGRTDLSLVEHWGGLSGYGKEIT